MKQTPKKKALDAIQKLSRVAAADENGYCECVSCRQWFHWTEMDGGHFIAKGHSSFWSLRKENIHPQCKGCNGYGMKYGTAAQEYTKWMIDYYGRDFVDQMEQEKRLVCKLSKKDLEEMTKEFNQEISYHLQRIKGAA